jgi:hypothetical protein
VNPSLDLSAISGTALNVIAGWTALCATVSLINRWLIAPNFPKVGRGVSAALSILPGHVGQLIADIKAIIADIQGAPPASPNASAPVIPEAPKAPPANTRNRLGLAGFGAAALFAFQTMAFGVATQGCGGTLPTIVTPPSAPTDITGAVTCVTAAVLAGGSIQPCIDKYGQALINDAIQTLLDSKEFAAAHPDAYSTLQVHAIQSAK